MATIRIGVPAFLLEGASTEERLRLPILFGVSLLSSILAFAGAWISHNQGTPGSSALSIVSAVIWMLPIPVFAWTRSLPLAGSLIPLGIFINLGGHAAWEWDESLSLVFLFLVPLSAVLLMGARQGSVWLAVTVAGIWPIAVAHHERVGAGTVSVEWSSWIAIAFTVVIFAAFALGERVRTRALKSAEAHRRAAEETSRQLDAEQRRFRAISEGSFHTITETDQEGRVIYTNPRFAEVLGYSLEEIVGSHPSDLLADPPATPPRVEQVIKSGQRFEAKNRHRDGHIVWQEVTATRYETEDDEERWIFAGRDVTREKAERERLQEAQKLESLGLLAGGVAHDFNNLLTVISGYAEELGEGEAEEAIRVAAQRAALLTGQLLAFGRKQLLRPRVLCLDELVRDAHDVLKSLVREEVRIECKLDSAPDLVRLDPNQMQRVLVNLATNSRDAMPTGGTLLIETRRTLLAPEEARVIGVPPGAYSQLLVTDTGSGMSPGTRDRAFEPFFTTKEVGEGTGLGLASVHGIVEQSHGGIHLTSSPDSGTQVSLFFPSVLEEEPLSVGAPELPSESPQRPLRILLVEDEDGVRRLVKQTLERAGHSVMSAANGLEALKLVAGPSPPDMLVCDVVMPEMRGPELAQRLREVWPRLPVLLLSGYSGDQIGLVTAESPGSAFLAKPFAPAALIQAVQELIDAC